MILLGWQEKDRRFLKCAVECSQVSFLKMRNRRRRGRKGRESRVLCLPVTARDVRVRGKEVQDNNDNDLYS